MKYVSSKFGEPEKRTSKIVLATSATTILLRINPSKKSYRKLRKSYKNWSHKLHLQKHWLFISPTLLKTPLKTPLKTTRSYEKFGPFTAAITRRRVSNSFLLHSRSSTITIIIKKHAVVTRIRDVIFGTTLSFPLRFSTSFASVLKPRFSQPFVPLSHVE